MTNYLPNYTAVICFHVTTVYQLNNANYYRIMISKTKVSKMPGYFSLSFFIWDKNLRPVLSLTVDWNELDMM